MRREEANTLDSVDRMHRLQQVPQVKVAVKVVPVRVHVLAEQGDLANAPIGEQLDLADDVGDGAADLPSTAIWNDAEGAELVAAVNDRDIRRDVRPRGERPDASLRVDAHAVAEQVDQRSELLRAHEDVDLWEPLLERVGLGPDHAAHEGDDLVAVLLLHRLEVT